jgi:hypothetical protein
MKRTTGLLKARNRSDVTGAGGGNRRACTTEDTAVKMVCMYGARNARIKRPTTAGGSESWLRENKRGYGK